MSLPSEGDVHQTPQLPECKVKRNYACPSCNFFTQNPRHYLHHLRDVHGEKVNVYECPNCLYASRHFQKLARHARMVHGEEDVSAETTSIDSASHQMQTEQDMEHRCSICSYTCRTKHQLDKHERQEHIKTKFFRCTKCTYVTHMKARFTKHVKYHSMPMIKCEQCDFRTPYKWNLDRHCKNHNGKGAFKCSACNFTADIKQSLTVHEMNHHVPPVGQAAGLGVGRRRNKVGASDAAGAEVEMKAEHVSPTSSEKRRAPSPDFIDPDDIVQHANGNVYIKNKCKLCPYKSAWSSEMTRHEQKVHQLHQEVPKPTKKTPRPVPNLIPIPLPVKKSEEVEMSQKDINEICAKSGNSALRDFAKLFNSEEVFEKCDDVKECKKNSSFFDKLQETLINGTSLTCQVCGHKSNCLSEHIKHQQKCGEETNMRQCVASSFISSSRCQFCRQRCKSSAGLSQHLQTCQKALENQEEDQEPKPPHPMENKVFVWNNIETPMEIDYPTDDNVSLDLSIRTQSPISERSESSYVGPTHLSPVTDKIPTHGNDISVAQHKRVFKCPHCTFWASTASRFHVHIVGHLNKKPFECSLCSYRSNWRWDITKHIKLKSVRDPAHESAKVLMTDETGRRNYTKYNKYLTEINVGGESSGGSGTRNHQKNSDGKLGKEALLRPPPPLKAADSSFFKMEKGKRAQQQQQQQQQEGKRTLFKCKKCNFRDASRDILLHHVKGHYPQNASLMSSPFVDTVATSPQSLSPSSRDQFLHNNNNDSSPDLVEEEASRQPCQSHGQAAPFRCGHCNQVSNWKHVIQRHCRLKHHGDVRVVSNKNGMEKVEIEEQPFQDSSDHLDVSQDGTFKCPHCPFSTDDCEELDRHTPGHSSTSQSIMKCHFCDFFVDNKETLFDHLKLHGVPDPADFLQKLYENANEPGKKFKCILCPYVTNSKGQYIHHKKFHQPSTGQFACTQCSYNVSKRHLLHQHLKVHGLSSQMSNGEVIDLDELGEEIEEVQQNEFTDIPLVWVSKNGNFSKMFKCRFCPHVNLRKVNIQEHEKMHSPREKTSVRGNEVEHRCTECNYVCNNAGVLSSHTKVHQGMYGMVHCLVDPVKSDQEQISELTRYLNACGSEVEEEDSLIEECEDVMYFCRECPARFLKENEYKIHIGLHNLRSYYKCVHCSYSAREKPHLLAHNHVHGDQYQKRTQELKSVNKPANEPPVLRMASTNDGGDIWIVVKDDLDIEMETLKPCKSSTNVPISGTELFAQKEAEQKQQAQLFSSQQLLNTSGNPNFIYPTYLKNGKMKEKRYKCEKCPSAFEKREQYLVHVNLHGSNQRYKCEHCDYSVKYYANYVQHLKKHKMNSEAQAALETTPPKLSLCDKQTSNILQQRLLVSSKQAQEEAEEKPDESFVSCTSCPFVTTSQDMLVEHLSHHDNVKKEGLVICPHCDFSAMEEEVMEEHQKVHFRVGGAGAKVEGYMYCEGMKVLGGKGEIVFEEKDGGGFGPGEVGGFNNNDGEKNYVKMLP